mmetsp:Transcript_37742/g.87887  ORF Transcript_37742/g.87887 Transcript_37742/m.87887 type:complete len:139 (+) Transcript_37742:901-1317(+)
MTVISWELTEQSTIPWRTFDCFFFNTSEETRYQTYIGRFLGRVLEKAYGSSSISRKLSSEGANICDALAAAYCIDNSTMISHEDVHVEVETMSPLTMGQTILDRGQCYDGIERVKNVRWGTKINLEKYIGMLEAICLK